MKKILRKLHLNIASFIINHADSYELNEIVHIIIKRSTDAFPNCETAFVAVPKDNPEERKRILESLSTALDTSCQ